LLAQVYACWSEKCLQARCDRRIEAQSSEAKWEEPAVRHW